MTLQKPSDAENEYFSREQAQTLARLAEERRLAGERPAVVKLDRQADQVEKD